MGSDAGVTPGVVPVAGLEEVNAVAGSRSAGDAGGAPVWTSVGTSFPLPSSPSFPSEDSTVLGSSSTSTSEAPLSGLSSSTWESFPPAASWSSSHLVSGLSGGVREVWEPAAESSNLGFFCPVRLGTGLARHTPLSTAVVSEASEPEDPEQENNRGSSTPVPFWVTRSSFFFRDLFLFLVTVAPPILWLMLGLSGLGWSAGSKIHGMGPPWVGHRSAGGNPNMLSGRIMSCPGAQAKGMNASEIQTKCVSGDWTPLRPVVQSL